MVHILDDANEQYFDQKYPLNLQKQNQEEEQRELLLQLPNRHSPEEQPGTAVDKLIEYIFKYWNIFVSSYLFVKNLPIIISKDIKIYLLLKSDIFQVEFDFDEWPGHQIYGTECIRGYQKLFLPWGQITRQCFGRISWTQTNTCI